MSSLIQIMEKPDWVSWEAVKQCLADAHAVNRARGIHMSLYQWPVDKIRESIGSNGVMLVALDGDKVVGTAAIREKHSKVWYANGRYAYLCFACVLPEYSGRGIYKELLRRREEMARAQRYSVFVFDTHEKNTKIRRIAKSNGYRLVNYYRIKDHYNAIMVKWPEGSPYTNIYCRLRFVVSWVRAHLHVCCMAKDETLIHR